MATDTPRAAPDAPPASNTADLRVLLEVLGPGLVRVHTAPRGLDAAVGDVVIADPLGDPSGGPVASRDDVILAVGVDATRREAEDLVAAAGAAGACAVCLRGPTVAGEAVDAAMASGVALLVVDPELSWSQLHVLLRSARAASGSPSSDAGPTSAPVGDLFALADALAAVVGGPVTVEDPQSTVLAYSRDQAGVDEPRRRTILGRKVPDEWLARLTEEGVFRRLWSSDDVVHFRGDAAEVAPRMAVAVRAGGEILGSIWALELDRPFDAEAERALQEAARVAALHLLRHRSHEDIERRRRSDRWRAVLDGSLPTGVLHETLGQPMDLPVTVIALRLDEVDRSGALRDAERAVDLVGLHCRAYRLPVAAVAVEDTVYVLLPDRDGPTTAATLARTLTERVAGGLHVPVTAGVSTAAQGPLAAASARAEADAVLRVLAARADLGPVAVIDDVRSHVVLAALREVATVNPDLLAGRMATLVEHDREKGTSYVETLRALLDAFGDVRAAADRVSVHPNTFRYRIRRLLEVAGLDIDDPVDRLVAHLQLHLLSSPTTQAQREPTA
ncbi:MAG TPA: helix-turn-helix domain-containing protein [Mycobacteriales bacterium]|nr:helix-turn-helix domain-containing protein [Mycobacteriales bacterium]